MIFGLWALFACNTAPPPTLPSGVTVFGEHRCDAPELRIEHRFDVSQTDSPPASVSYLWGAGIVAADFTGNGRLEIVTIGEDSLEYLEWTGSAWSARAGLPDTVGPRGFGGVAADLDADGDLDLFISSWGEPNHYFENQGDGRFLDHTAAAGLNGPVDHHSASASVADVDLDGDLDLFVAGHGWIDEHGANPSHFDPADPSLLYLNQGDGTFTADHSLLPASIKGGYTFLGGLQDLNGDQRPDLLLINDFGRAYRAGQLLWNQPTGFYPDNNQAGLDLPVAGMGLAYTELNHDGVPDLLVPYWGGYRFMLSNDGQWFDWSNASGLRPLLAQNQTVGWGANFGDLNNDGHPDVVVMHGHLDTHVTVSQPSQPNAIFIGRDDGFDNRTQAWDFVDRDDNRGLVVADFDGNGWLDIARPSLNGPTKIYMARCGAEASLNVRLHQPGANPDAIGATVDVAFGSKTTSQSVRAGGEGYGSAGPPELHFGLAEADTVQIEVTWPDGAHSSYADLPTHTHIRIERELP